MMLAVPKSDILQAIMVSYGNREEIKEFLGENLWKIQEASTGDIIVKLTTGEFMVLKSWMFNALFDCHFVPNKPPETWP